MPATDKLAFSESFPHPSCFLTQGELQIITGLGGRRLSWAGRSGGKEHGVVKAEHKLVLVTRELLFSCWCVIFFFYLFFSSCLVTDCIWNKRNIEQEASLLLLGLVRQGRNRKSVD